MYIVLELARIDGNTCTILLLPCWNDVWLIHRRSLDCMNDVSASITKLNPKSKLHVIREAPQTLLPKLFKEWQVTHLVFEKDTDAYARDRDAEVSRLAKEAGVEVVIKVGRTLYDPDELVKENGGRPTMSISQVEKVRLQHVVSPIAYSLLS